MPALELTCSRSPELVARYPDMRFSAVAIADLDGPGFARVVGEYVDSVIRGAAADEAMRECLRANEAFFERHGHVCPLTGQIAAFAKRSRAAPPPVEALLALEAATGVLMGVQDLRAIDRRLTLDSLVGEESFTGMRGDDVRCAPGEIVVRDATGIIASLFQGPDRRTRVRAGSTGLVFFLFDADPSLGRRHDEATRIAARLLPKELGTTHVLVAP